MAIGKVSFGAQPQINQQQEIKKPTGVLKGTAIAAGLGAGVAGAADLGFMSLKNVIIKSIRKNTANANQFLKNIFGNTDQTKALIVENCKKAFSEIKKIRAFNYKNVIKNAGRAALIWGAVYLGYRGIKSLFTNK